ncbi:glycosyltransferase [Flagellimonas oceanensis]|uniref:glycosyltransferase n=1 Tax=Flagellimonas oceanensis TaxID=2499163 RepID=UPI003BA84BBD
MIKDRILHLSNDFADQKIYVNLVKRLSKIGYEQIVYVPLKWENKIDGNRDDTIPNVSYHYSFILRRNILFRFRYFNKIRLIKNDLKSKVDLSAISMVHAHFLFSDGGVAYLLKKEYGIPYVVSVRASDIFTFFKKMPHLRKFGNRIMRDADKVIFINPSYVELFQKNYLKKAFKGILKKTTVVPNAIDDKWFSNNAFTKKTSYPIRILYVGRIIKRKKLDLVIRAVQELNKREGKNNFVLEIVGDGIFLEYAKKLADENIIFHGKIRNFKSLSEIYNRCHLFAMPSLKETFGLVYIEALSQGLPIIYCTGEGVDGFFDKGEVGVAVRPNNLEDLIVAVKQIVKNYEALSEKGKIASKKFNWNECTNVFDTIYQDAIHKG